MDLLDKYVKGQLSQEERRILEENIKSSDEFGDIVKEHVDLVDAMLVYGERIRLRSQLDKFHEDVSLKTQPKVVNPSFFKKYWPVTAIAASVAFISAVGTFLLTTDYGRNDIKFQSLGRKVDQIARNQRKIEQDLAETKKTNLPGNFAGTCFMISKGGFLVTSYHVVRDADSLFIENEKFGRLKATVSYTDKDNDLSILKVDTSLLVLPYVIEKSEASLAEDVFTLGYPREDIVYGEGAISALTGYQQNPNSYQVSVPVNPGNSGGPLLNSKGNLVGMISGLQTETAGAAFAIKSSVLVGIVEKDSLMNSVTLPKMNSLKSTQRVGQVAQLKDYVFMVRVFKN